MLGRLLDKAWHSANPLLSPKRLSTAVLATPPITNNNVTVYVNNKAVSVPSTATIMQACAAAGIDIPRFCYHERLGVAGNCRMCLVQVNKGPKLVASCAAPVIKDSRIETASDPVLKAREGVMEFLLANHPLDCPICDQGGECDLQDQAMAFGSDQSRFQIYVHNKRAVEDKHLGPLIKTSMNRCIHCTRCVRFANEVAGVQQLGTTGRGNDMQIGTYIEGVTINSELSGNLVDLCPVGALTSRPYAFMARPWELKSTESIDVLDAVGSAIRVDSRGLEVMRILPRLNETVNEEWIGDKSRFSCDALRLQRLTQPLARNSQGMLSPIEWEDALTLFANKLRSTPPNQIESVAGDFADVETLVVAKDLLARLGCTNLRFDGPLWDSSVLPGIDAPASYKFNSTIAGIEQADMILLIGTNLKKEAPVVNARLFKHWLRKGVPIGLIGENVYLNYQYTHLGSDCEAFNILEEKANATTTIATTTATVTSSTSQHNKNRDEFIQKFSMAQRPMIIVAHDSVYGPGGAKVMERLTGLCKKVPNLIREHEWNGLNFLPTMASRVGALDIGWRALQSRHHASTPKLIYLINADEIPDGMISSDAFVVYQGHHGDRGVQYADLVLPAAAYTEKTTRWVNMEGRVQSTTQAVPIPGDARLDWKIVRAVAEVAGIDIAYDDPEIRIGQIAPHLLKNQYYYEFNRQDALDNLSLTELEERSTALDLENTLVRDSLVTENQVPLLKSRIADYHLSDCISRASPTMAQCSQAKMTQSP